MSLKQYDEFLTQNKVSTNRAQTQKVKQVGENIVKAGMAYGKDRNIQSDLQNYEAIMLSNVPATSLTMRPMAVMRTYVQDLGGGLVMLGGDQSFGLGGYYKTTLEEILPVRSDFEKEKEKLASAEMQLNKVLEQIDTIKAL